MKIVLLYHSVLSDWNNGNAHFLRGIVSSLITMGHEVKVLEPREGWSLRSLLQEHGNRALKDFSEFFPFHMPEIYNEKNFAPENYLDDADMVIVHEWNNPEIVSSVGRYKTGKRNLILLFHDTHHRSVTAPGEMEKFELGNYDGVLASGEVIRNIYLEKGWARNAWVWHEAADDRIFHPVASDEKAGDLVWIGNWGDDERTDELQEFIIEPVMELGLEAAFYGVRYPVKAIKMLKKARIRYMGWVPNYLVPEVFSKYRVTVHVPRRPYVKNLPGIPTIRPFEAMACKIPLICSPWEDREKLFTRGRDYLVAYDGDEMVKQLRKILNDKDFADRLAGHALETIRSHHTCDHRAEQLMGIVNEIRAERTVRSNSRAMKM